MFFIQQFRFDSVLGVDIPNASSPTALNSSPTEKVQVLLVMSNSLFGSHLEIELYKIFYFFHTFLGAGIAQLHLPATFFLLAHL
jgi:hypothetical protein